jgi:hypothetical protein
VFAKKWLGLLRQAMQAEERECAFCALPAAAGLVD